MNDNWRRTFLLISQSMSAKLLRSMCICTATASGPSPADHLGNAGPKPVSSLHSEGKSEGQNGNAKAAPDTAKAYMPSAPQTPQAPSTTADDMRLRQQESQIWSLQGDVDKQAEELDLYMQDC
ncbi:hypothetical protein WJX77_009779 [Trebouxia sp. C0004]